MSRTAEYPPVLLETATPPADGPDREVDDSPGFFLQMRADPIARNCALLLLAGIIWQVFALGFYLDDWIFVVKTARADAGFSLDRWHAVRLNSLPRPGLTPLWYGLTSILGDQPILWHAALLGVNILFVCVLFKISLQLTPDKTERITRVLFLSVLYWFLLPWNACFHFWLTDVPVMLIMTLFAWCVFLVVRGWNNGRPTFWAPFAGYLWACVGYEATYFQWIPVALIGVTFVLARRTHWTRIARGLLPLIAAQACAVAWYFVSVRMYGNGNQNRIVPDWPRFFLSNLIRMPQEALKSTEETNWIFIPALVGWFVLVCLIFVSSLSSTYQRKSALINFGYILSCLAGIILSVLAFSLGGRPIAGLGVDARGFLLADFWFVLGGGIATAYCWKLADGWRLIALRIIVVIAATALMGGHLQRAFDWATGWRLQQQLLAEAPVPEMKKMEPGAAVLLVKPFSFHGVPTLNAPWDINAAMSLTHPATAGHEFIVYNPWLGPLKWSGGQLAYSSLVVSKLAPLYIWRPFEHEFFKAPEYLRVDGDLSLHTSP